MCTSVNGRRLNDLHLYDLTDDNRHNYEDKLDTNTYKKVHVEQPEQKQSGTSKRQSR